MPKYASQTTVSPDKSRSEIEAILKRYGASHYGYMSGPDTAAIAFQANDRRLRFTLPLPKREDHKYDKRGYYRAEGAIDASWQQAIRQRWRALALVIKAKLEAVEAGVSTFEEEFMANIILPSGQTMAEYALPQITQAYETGTMPPLLGYGG